MNKDQKLLEEAYSSIYKNKNVTVLLPEEELFVEKVSRYIFDNIYIKLENYEDGALNHKTLNGILKREPVNAFLSVLNPPGNLKSDFEELYVDDACSSLWMNVSFGNYLKVDGKVDTTPYLYFNDIDPADEFSYIETKVPLEDKKGILSHIKGHTTAFLQHSIKAAYRDDNYTDVLKWRDKMFKDIETTKKLSKDFDISALEDFG